MLDVPSPQRNIIRYSLNLNNAAKLDKVLLYTINTHPYGSWRLLIWAYDEMGWGRDADALRAYAEPVGKYCGCVALIISTPYQSTCDVFYKTLKTIPARADPGFWNG